MSLADIRPISTLLCLYQMFTIFLISL